MRTLLISILSLLMFTACSQKVLITATKPALIDRASKTKKIAVLQFANDDKVVSFGTKIEASLYNIKIKDKPYFTIISKNRDDILKEQKFQYSGLENKKNIVEVGELLGAQALITGKIDIADMKKEDTTTQSSRCANEKCTYKVIEYGGCIINARYTLKATISMIDVQKGDIIYTDNYTQIANHWTCLNKMYKAVFGDLPPISKVFDDLSNKILEKFLPNISPTTQTYYIKVFEDPEIKYTKEQKQILENALRYLKHNNLDKAEELFSKLLNSTNDKCYLAAYNLGIIKESKGEYENAKELYELADDLTNKPNNTIFQSITRINTQIENYKKLQKQLNN